MTIVVAVVLFVSLFQFSTFDQEFQVNRGTFTEITNYPFIVAVRYDDEFFCGGSIISRSVILTSAHCINNSTGHNVTIRVGNSWNAAGTTYVIDRHIAHPSFNFATKDYDIAVLHISQELILGPKVKIATMASNRLDAGSSVQIIGWGSYFDYGPTSDRLREAPAKILSLDECRRKQPYTITERMVCANNELGMNVCSGDSGSPLVDAEAKKIVGVCAFGDCSETAGSVYASIPDLLGWIQTNARNV